MIIAQGLSHERGWVVGGGSSSCQRRFSMSDKLAGGLGTLSGLLVLPRLPANHQSQGRTNTNQHAELRCFSTTA